MKGESLIKLEDKKATVWERGGKGASEEYKF